VSLVGHCTRPDRPWAPLPPQIISLNFQYSHVYNLLPFLRDIPVVSSVATVSAYTLIRVIRRASEVAYPIGSKGASDPTCIRVCSYPLRTISGAIPLTVTEWSFLVYCRHLHGAQTIIIFIFTIPDFVQILKINGFLKKGIRAVLV